MPLLACSADGDPGFKFGATGTCYTYKADDETAKAAAKKKAIKQAVAIGGGKAPADLADELDDPDEVAELRAFVAVAEQDYALESLPTVDIKGVEILSAGGPYYGTGSPTGGDHFTKAFIKKLAADTQKLITAKELRPPNKIGHTTAQKLLKESGIKAASPDERPAAGWITKVYEKDGKVLADISKVPAKVARLLKARAWSTRSVELRTLDSQTEPGVKYRVITGLAWLGEKMPAVRTLDDIIASYAADGIEPSDPLSDTDALVVALTELEAPDEAELADALAAGDIVWKPEEGFQYLRDTVNAALNPTGMQSRFWVRDVTTDKALVTEYNGGESQAWVVPFSYDDSGDVVLPPSSDWVKVEQAWVEGGAAQLAELVAVIEAGRITLSDDTRDRVARALGLPADTSGEMATETQKPKLTDENIVALATAFAIEETDDAKRREAVEAKLAEFAPEVEETKPEPKPAPETSLSAADAEVLKAKAERGDRAYEELRTARQTREIDRALEEGRLDPAKQEFWEKQFEEMNDDERVITLLHELPVNPEYKAAFGRDGDGSGEDGSGDDSAYLSYMRGLGYGDDELATVRSATA